MIKKKPSIAPVENQKMIFAVFKKRLFFPELSSLFTDLGADDLDFAAFVTFI